MRRARRPVLRAPRRTLALAAVASVFVIAAPVGAMAYIRDRGARRARAWPSASPSTRRAASAPPPATRTSRAPTRRCAIRSVPDADRRAQLPNAPCDAHRRERPLSVCEFGAPARRNARGRADRRQPRLALARRDRTRRAAEGWRGVSITHSGCAFSRRRQARRSRALERLRALAIGDPALARAPSAGSHGLRLRHHRRPGDRRARRTSASRPRSAATSRRGASCRDSVRRIVVLRDTPRMRTPTIACVQHALDAHAPTPARAACRARRRSRRTRP